jgi:hypothetical protein
MGIGSPRLLRQTGVIVLAALAFAPAAFADDISVPVSADVGAVSATITAAVPAVAVPAADAPALPATPVAKARVKPHPQVQVTADTSPRARLTTRIGAVDRPVADRTGTRTASQAPQARRIPPRTDSKLVRRPSSHLLAPTTSFSPREAPAIAAAAQSAPDAASASAPPAPQLPLPLTFGLGGSSGTVALALGLLLLALAAELLLLGAPGLGRRLALLVAAPRPYPYLLRLERPG